MSGNVNVHVRVEMIIETAAAMFDLDSRDIKSGRRDKAYRLARGLAMRTARKTTLLSYPSIARLFNDRDHTSVITTVARMEKLIDSDPGISAMADRLIEAVEYREMVTARNTIDALALARRISLNPRRAAILATTHEVVALGEMVLNLWEIASAAEALAAAVQDTIDPFDKCHALLRMRALAAAICTEVCVLAGEPSAECDHETTETNPTETENNHE